jgi:Flp pilus assembly protein TadG
MRPRSSRPRRRDESGVSAVELVLYMPLLMLVIFLAVQLSLVWFGNQAASAAAREAARSARVYGDEGRAVGAGRHYAATIGDGVLEDAEVSVQIVGDRVRVTVTGRAQELLPFGVPTVSQTVEGPLEEFQEPAP